MIDAPVHLPRIEAEPTEEEIEAAAIAVRSADNCGLNLKGEHVFCDDTRLADQKDGYGNNLRCNVCQCKIMAKAALTAAAKVRRGDG